MNNAAVSDHCLLVGPLYTQYRGLNIFFRESDSTTQRQSPVYIQKKSCSINKVWRSQQLLTTAQTHWVRNERAFRGRANQTTIVLHIVKAVWCLAEETKHGPRMCRGIFTKRHFIYCLSTSDDLQRVPEQIRSRRIPVITHRLYRGECKGNGFKEKLRGAIYSVCICCMTQFPILESLTLP